MLKALTTTGVLILGLSEDNIKWLERGQPIDIKPDQLLSEAELLSLRRIVIFAGKDEESMLRELESKFPKAAGYQADRRPDPSRAP